VQRNSLKRFTAEDDCCQLSPTDGEIRNGLPGRIRNARSNFFTPAFLWTNYRAAYGTITGVATSRTTFMAGRRKGRRKHSWCELGRTSCGQSLGVKCEQFLERSVAFFLNGGRRRTSCGGESGDPYLRAQKCSARAALTLALADQARNPVVGANLYAVAIKNSSTPNLSQLRCLHDPTTRRRRRWWSPFAKPVARIRSGGTVCGRHSWQTSPIP